MQGRARNLECSLRILLKSLDPRDGAKAVGDRPGMTVHKKAHDDLLT